MRVVLESAPDRRERLIALLHVFVTTVTERSPPAAVTLRAGGEHRARKVGVVATQSPAGTAVLIVEDESLIRGAAAEFLEASGYRVFEAANADEAIALLESRDDIRVVFTDINMPGSMDGLRLAHAIRERWPPIVLIVTSGRGSPDARDFPPGAEFLPKPYDYRNIAAMLQRLAN
jgi:two-component system, response regulator PdtaR